MKSPRLLTQILYIIEIQIPLIDLGNATVLAAVQLTAADLQALWKFQPAPSA